MATEQAAGANGQFARESDSAAGQAQKAAAQWENAKAAIGTGLLPVVAALSGKLATLAGWMGKHPTLILVVVTVIGLLAAAILALNVAVGVYTAVTTLAASATVAAWVAALWPILAVIAAVGLVVGAVVLLWKKSETFRNVVMAVWGAIKRGATATARWIVNAWNTIKASASAVFRWIGSAWRNTTSAITNAIARVKAAWSTAMEWIRGKARTITDAIKTMWGNVRDALERAMSGLGKVLVAPFNLAKEAVDRVWDAIQRAIDAVQSLKNTGGKLLDRVLPGSIAAAPAIAPTGRGAVSTPAASAGGAPVVVNVYGAVDPEGTARTIKRVLAGHDRRVGRARPVLVPGA
jgi:phage-related protein